MTTMTTCVTQPSLTSCEEKIRDFSKRGDRICKQLDEISIALSGMPPSIFDTKDHRYTTHSLDKRTKILGE